MGTEKSPNKTISIRSQFLHVHKIKYRLETRFSYKLSNGLADMKIYDRNRLDTTFCILPLSLCSQNTEK